METAATWLLWAVAAYFALSLFTVLMMILAGLLYIFWPRKRRK